MEYRSSIILKYFYINILIDFSLNNPVNSGTLPVPKTIVPHDIIWFLVLKNNTVLKRVDLHTLSVEG